MKGPLFVPTPSDVKCYEMWKDFNKFFNQLPFKTRKIIEPNANKTNDVTLNKGISAPKKPESKYWSIIQQKRNQIQKFRDIHRKYGKRTVQAWKYQTSKKQP